MIKNGMNHIYACLLLVTVLGLAGTASALPITFDEFPVGTLIGNQYESDGVVFLPGVVTCDLPQISMDAWMPTEPLLRPTNGIHSPYYGFQGDFYMKFVQPVGQVEFLTGSWDQVGAGTIQVYDPAMNLVGSFSNTQVGPQTICISGLGPIREVYFNSTRDYGGAGIDNLDFCTIPAPGAILLGGLGASLVGWLRRRKVLA